MSDPGSFWGSTPIHKMQIILRIILILIKYVLLLKGGFPHPAQVGPRHR